MPLLVFALIVGGVVAQATGILNTPEGGYVVCVNVKTKVVTHPGTSSCPKGSKRLVLGAQGVAGAGRCPTWPAKAAGALFELNPKVAFQGDCGTISVPRAISSAG